MKLGQRMLTAMPVATTVFFFASGGVDAQSENLTRIELLGKNVFFDTSLSTPGNKQGCVSCHDPAKGWTFPDLAVNNGQVVAPGAAPHALGNIKTPTNAYASEIAPFAPCGLGAPGSGNHCGGNFWDGRAEGYGSPGAPTPGTPAGDGAVSETITMDDLGPSTQYAEYLGPTADQALNPFPNTVEQNIREKKVCQQVKTAKYKALYEEAFGEPIDCTKNPKNNPAYRTSFKRIAVALAAYQASPDVSSFTSKRDKALQRELEGTDIDGTPGEFPLVGLTAEENLGHDLFYGVESDLNPTGKNAQCSFCHSDNPGIPFPPPGTPGDTGAEPTQLYADDAYHNIGTPFNREIPSVTKGEKIGVAAHLSSAQPGFFKTPTLRNVGKGEGPDFVKAFAHNGWFKSLASIVHFYNTRDVFQKCEELGLIDATEAEARAVAEEGEMVGCWPESEFAGTTAPSFLVGDLGLSPEQEAALVAYMRTLTDEYTPTAP